MKPKSTLRLFLLTAVSVLISLPNANAAEYWWNQNGNTEGWGGGGTWDNASAVFSTTDSDTASAGTAATTTSDTLNFGTSTVGFAGGTITANGAIRNIGTIVTGSANTTADINLTNIRLRFADPGTITNDSPRALAISGIIEGTATRLDLNANGGDIQLTGAGSTYSGTTYINTGTVWSNNADCLGASGSDSNRTVIASGARLLFNNSRTYTERFEIAGAGVGGTTGALYNSNNRSTTLNGQVTLSGDATTYSDSSSNALTFGGGIVLGANALTFNSFNTGSIQTVQTTAISGTGSVVKAGSGILNLNVASSYSGGTTLNAGTINIGAAISGSNSAIGSTSGALIVNGGSLNMAGNNVTVGNLTGTGGVIRGTTGTRTLTIGEGDGGGGNFQGAIQNGSGGTTALIKTGTGSITLSGTNTYTGGTTINGGTLIITGATQATTAITFNGGSLGFDTGFPVAAASAAVDLANGTISIIGATGATSYTLLTAASITGTPVLAAPVPGYQLQVIDGATDELRLVQSGGVPSYDTWSGGAPFGGDANNDGVPNGLAFLLGASGPNVNALNNLPTTSQTGGNLVMSFTCLATADRGTSTLTLEYDGDLAGTWLSVPVPGAVGDPNPIVVTTTTGSVSFMATDGGTNGNGDALIVVVATISDATEAASGKLFGRVKAVNP